MCGGLARWLRILGIDAAYTPAILDHDLVALARDERRILISSDRRLFERRLLRDRTIRGLLLPVGLPLAAQVQHVFERLELLPGTPRCSTCNGELVPALREEVADAVPARTLVWITDYFRCSNCRRVFWEGTHWSRIREILHRVRG